MKKTISLIMAALLTAGLTACGGSSAPASTTAAPAATEAPATEAAATEAAATEAAEETAAAEVDYSKLAPTSIEYHSVAAIQQRGELHIATEATFAPYAFKDADGNLVGLEVDLSTRSPRTWA